MAAAGLLGSLDPQQQQEARPAPQRSSGRAQAEPPASSPDEEEPNVSPEEQAQYDHFVENALSLIYDERSLPQVIRSLGGHGDPIEGLANTAIMVITRLEDSAGGHGAIDGDILFHGGVEIIEDLADLAEEAGLTEFSEADLEAATYRALDLYRMMRQGDGTLDEGPIRQEFEELMALDRQGALAQALPEVEQHFQQVGPSAAAAGAPGPAPQQGMPQGRGPR